MNSTRFVGLDVHAATIAVAVAEPDGEVRGLGIIPNEPDAVRRLVKRLGPAARLRACYEAGPCGYTLYWQRIGRTNATSGEAAGVRPGPASPASPGEPDPAPGTARVVEAKESGGLAIAR